MGTRIGFIRRAVASFAACCLLGCGQGASDAPEDAATDAVVESDADAALSGDGSTAEDADASLSDVEEESDARDAGPLDTEGNDAVDSGDEDGSEVDAGGDTSEEGDAGEPGTLGELVVQLQSQGVASVGEATVSIGDETFSVPDGELTLPDRSPGRVVLRISADGFLDASVPVDLAAGQTAVATVALLPEGRTFTLDVSSPINVREQNVRLTLPANAFVDANGELVTGTIEATITPFDLDGRYDFPGTMGGEMEREGTLEPVQLLSYGMAEFTFRQGAEELQLSADACGETSLGRCVVAFQLDRDTTPLAVGDEVPLWSYDEERAVWDYESIASVRERDGQLVLEGAVDHFSWWNTDVPAFDEDMACVGVVVRYPDGSPYTESSLYAAARSFNPYTTSERARLSNAEGCVLVPAGREWTVYVGDRSGPFASQDIFVPSAEDCPTCSARAVFVRPAPGCVEGQVVLDGGAPAEDALVVAWPSGDETSPATQTRTDASGRYCVPVGRGGSWEISASLLDSSASEQAAQATVLVTVDSAAATCGGAECAAAPTLNLESADVACYAGVVRDGATGNPLPQGTSLHVYLSDGVPSEGIPAGDSPETAYPGYQSTSVVQSDGTYCLDVPTGVGELEVVLEPLLIRGGDPAESCGSELAPPSYCSAESAILAEPAEEFEGARCATGGGVWCEPLEMSFGGGDGGGGGGGGGGGDGGGFD